MLRSLERTGFFFRENIHILDKENIEFWGWWLVLVYIHQYSWFSDLLNAVKEFLSKKEKLI